MTNTLLQLWFMEDFKKQHNRFSELKREVKFAFEVMVLLAFCRVILKDVVDCPSREEKGNQSMARSGL